AADADGRSPTPLFTENETNFERVFGVPNVQPYVKDAFHEYVVHGRHDRVNPANRGSKAAFYYRAEVPAGASITYRLRLVASDDVPAEPFGSAFDATFAARRAEA